MSNTKASVDRAVMCGDVVMVDFALGSADVVIDSSHIVADGETIYHVSDIHTGHQDFVGASWIST